MRPIDADKLKGIKFNSISNDKYGAYRMGWNDAIDAIVDNAPTAELVIPVKQITEAIADKYGEIAIPSADAVEVVRCKDCKHNYRRTTWNHGERDNPACKYTNYVRENDFYCSYGERAEV